MKDPELAAEDTKQMKDNSTGKKVHSLIDKVYHPTNLELAWGSVKANGGSGGIDKVIIPMFDEV